MTTSSGAGSCVLTGLRIGLVGPLPPPSGGMANLTRQLAELLAAEDAVVTWVPVNAPYRPRWVARVPMLRAVFRLLPYWVALWRVAGQSDVFHVMANSGWSWHLWAAPAIWVAHWRGVAVVVNYHGGEADKFLQRAHRAVRLTLGQRSVLVVPSGFLVDVFSRFNLASQIVPNVIDLSRFPPRHPVRAGAPHLLVARNLEPIYDIDTALRAFQLVRQDFAHARLTLAGSGPEARRLQQWVDAQGLSDVVHLTGRLECEAMAALYRSADLVLNPSRVDNMPLSILEAWSSGVPVVSTDVGGITYLAQDGVNASLVAPADPSAMARACVALLSDEALWQQRAQAGLQAVQRYTWARVQPVLKSAYQRALKQALH